MIDSPVPAWYRERGFAPARNHPEWDDMAFQGTNPVFRDALEWGKQEWQTRERAYGDLLRSVGRVGDIPRFLKSQKAQSQMIMMGNAMADRMERLGMGGYRAQGEPVWVIGGFSWMIHQMPNYRRNKYNPYVCHEKRSTILKELEYILLVKKTESFRMIVITGGGGEDNGRVTSMDVCRRWDWQNRRIRLFNKSPKARRLGVQFIFRSNELGSPLKKKHHKEPDGKGRWVRPYIRDEQGNRIRCLDEQGRQTYHPHTHAVLHMSRYLGPQEWKELIAFLQDHFEQAKPDAGAIVDAREACKYMVKTDELMELRDIDFMRIFRRLNKRRTVELLGDLRLQARKHREQCMRLRYVQTKATQTELDLRPVKNWNQKPLGFKERKNLQWEQLQAEERAEQGPRHTGDPVLLARCAPAPRFTPVAEPCFVFRGAIDKATALSNHRVRYALQQCAEAWDLGALTFTATTGYDVTEWATTVAPLLAASAGVSAHTTPVTGTRAEKSGAAQPGPLPLLGETAPPEPPWTPTRANFDAKPERWTRKSPVAMATGASPFVGDFYPNQTKPQNQEKSYAILE